MLAGLLKIVAIWLILDATIMTVGWYFATVVKPRYTDWWWRAIADKNRRPDTHHI